MRILVTGSAGFVGASLLPILLEAGHDLRLAMHKKQVTIGGNNKKKKIETVNFDLSSDNNNYDKLLNEIDVVIHLAAKVHSINDTNYASYKLMNYTGTHRLATEASKRKVKRFIYLSTIKVNGECNSTDNSNNILPFTEQDALSPNDPYARSKLESEIDLKEICEKVGMEYVIFRPVLVYGPGVGANFLALINAVNKQIPLPLASVNNRRSFVYVKNLADAIFVTVNSGERLNNTFLISDSDVSFPELHREIAKHLNVKSLLFPFPIYILKGIGLLIGKKQVVSRLTDSLLADGSKFMSDMNWNPPYSFSEGIKETIDWYKNNKST